MNGGLRTIVPVNKFKLPGKRHRTMGIAELQD
jgi:hypothetical protein